MGKRLQLGGGVIGLMFLGVGVLKMAQGGNWVVWIILGFLFGGFGALSRLLGGKGEA